MKVIFAIRKDYTIHHGGDVVQMLKTKLFLEKIYQDIEIVICSTESEIEKYKYYDLMHIFNIQTYEESSKFCEIAKKFRIPVVLSPIFWDLEDAVYIGLLDKLDINTNIKIGKKLFFPIYRIIKKISKKDETAFLGKVYIEKIRYILESSEMILPNSYEEMDIIKKSFYNDIEKARLDYLVVPNAVDTSELKQQKSEFDFSNIEKFVLQVARVEPIKNQISVVKALINHPEIPIVFIGNTTLNAGYYKKVKKIADKRGNVYFLGQIPHDQIHEFYKRASVHVLPSFRESPGLSTLEALYYGTNVVASNVEYCPVNYYKLKEYGTLCDPYDISSIKKAILESIQQNKIEKMDHKDYFDFFSYDNVAKLTYEAYKGVLNNE